MGGETDWLNCGTVRPRGKLPDDRPKARIFLVRNFANIYSLTPERFEEEPHETSAIRINDLLITDIHATEMMAVGLNGLIPDRYALRSIRRGGETAL